MNSNEDAQAFLQVRTSTQFLMNYTPSYLCQILIATACILPQSKYRSDISCHAPSTSIDMITLMTPFLVIPKKG